MRFQINFTDFSRFRLILMWQMVIWGLNDTKVEVKYDSEKKYSRRHHYLPVFYLKGFCDSNDLFYVYDKISNRILKRQKPSSKFYEKNLNNYRMDGEVKFSLEERYFSPLDAEHSKILHKINDLQIGKEGDLSSLEKFQFLQFLTQLYFRLPQKTQLFKKLIKNEGLSNPFFGLQEEGSTDFISDFDPRLLKIKQDILDCEDIQKVFKHIIPLTDGALNEQYKLFDQWKIFSINVKKPNLITGDNPFLVNNPNPSFDNIFNELIFPISKHKLLILSEKSPEYLDQILMTSINLSILHQSHRYICCDNEEYILDLKKYYASFVQKGIDTSLLKDTFNYMYSNRHF